jgi:hypothetical protein
MYGAFLSPHFPRYQPTKNQGFSQRFEKMSPEMKKEHPLNGVACVKK